MIKTKLYTAEKIARIVGGELIGENVEVEYISTSSKEKQKGCFICLKGEKYDGESFADEAIKNGARLIVTSRKTPRDVSVIWVNDTKNALFKLAERNRIGTKVIGVTGSAGKTTVKEMIKDVLSQRYGVCATEKNQNNEIGVALTLLSVRNEDYCVVEMGMRGLGEIDFLAGMARPDISVITNIGSAHIERLGSYENIFLAKTEILRHTLSYAVIPNDERFKSLNYRHIKPVFVGKEGDYEARDIHLDGCISFNIFENNSFCTDASVPSWALHDANNAAIAFAVGRICSLSPNEIKKGLESFENGDGRGNIYKIGEITVIDDSYNASYESMLSSFSTLVEYAKLSGKRPYAVIGDMLEIGNESEEYHYRIGKRAREKGVIEIFTYGDFGKAVCEGFGGGRVFESKAEIEDFIANNFGKRDVLLFKASRAIGLETIIEGLKLRFNEN